MHLNGAYSVFTGGGFNTASDLQERDSVNVAQFLKRLLLRDMNHCHSVLLTSSKVIRQNILPILNEMKMAPISMVSYDVESFTSSAPPGTPVHRYIVNDSSSLYCVTFYILASIDQVERALANIPKTDWFSGASKYFVIYTGSHMNITDIGNSLSFLKSYNNLFISSSRPTAKGSSDDSWPLYLFSTCPFCRSGEPEIILRNRWSPRRGLMKRTELFPDLFRNCNGHVFRGVTLSFPPFMHYTEGNATHRIVLKDCLDRNIMRVISKYYNFSFDLYEPADGQWGYQLDNGSFTGVLGVVQRYEADFSMDISITAEREEVIDFTIGFHSEPLSFVTSKPQPLPQWMALVRPYKAYVWAFFVLTVAAAGPVYWLLQRSAGNRHLSLFNASFHMFASLITQSRQWPQKSSVRVYSLFWILFSLVATVSYVCNLTAFLTVPALSPTVDNLEDLSHSSFVWGINDYGAADYQLFKTSKAPLYQRIFRGLTFCPSLVECVQRTLDRRFAFISWRTYLRDVIAMNFTDKNGYTRVYLSRESFWPGDIGYAMQKGSPLKRGFDRILRRLIEGGFIEKWVTDLIQKHTLETQRMEKIKAGDEEGADQENDDRILKLTLHHLQGVFFVYAAGMLLSSFALFLELVTRRTVKGN
ncbi:probable glutamate receptor [Palaemon carinicauda]|uniref:probable glutamate receptor n=1 Tax=Palaemon carinicauda TaxID=392227 RepID=UPI0035B58012